ncbi:N-acetylmuramoyl-L-alanine amidase [Candidatus Agathobaculum pullicola]|uniref:N-acetylmuramoyl-L-alanine amidase n=1 Tax=Candidatus Agathobaculum pullicola TaxID=2838426 RepID=UPI003F8E7737
MNILLIAGHGGTPYDPGACGCGYTEAVETRRLATAVAPMLRKYGFNVTMYDQSNDAYKVLRSGGSLPLFGIGYVLEIHLNAGVSDKDGNGATTGTEVLVHTAESGVSVEQAICRRISALGFKNRGVKRRDNLQVMNTVHRAGISHALVEICFIDDADDMKLYKTKFYDIAHAIADGVAEGFGKTVQKEDDEVVEKKTVCIDGKNYTCDVIEKAGYNYVQLADLAQAGYGVTYDTKAKVPGIVAPQTRADVPNEDSEVQVAVKALQAACGLEESTMEYLRKYKYGDELVKKLAKAVQGNA